MAGREPELGLLFSWADVIKFQDVNHMIISPHGSIVIAIYISLSENSEWALFPEGSVGAEKWAE